MDEPGNFAQCDLQSMRSIQCVDMQLIAIGYLDQQIQVWVVDTEQLKSHTISIDETEDKILDEIQRNSSQMCSTLQERLQLLKSIKGHVKKRQISQAISALSNTME